MKKLHAISVAHHKNTAYSPARRMEVPKQVLIPMSMNIGAPAEPVVKVTDKVKVTEPMINLFDFYGRRGDFADICLIIFSRKFIGIYLIPTNLKLLQLCRLAMAIRISIKQLIKELR